MSPTKAEAVRLAAQVQERVFEAAMEWGAACNAAEADKGSVVLKLRAQDTGAELMRLAMGIAAVLRPASSGVGDG